MRGDIVTEILDPADRLLAVERLTLDLLTRLSGVATVANLTVGLARSVNPSVRITDTMKVAPDLKFLGKYAVEVGWGPHRSNSELY